MDLAELIKRTSATRLQTLGIDEVSLVDDPANMAPGWVVMKAARAPAPGGGYYAIVNRATGELTEFTSGPNTSKDEILAAMLIAGCDDDTVIGLGGTPEGIAKAMIKALPRHALREATAGKFRRSLIARHGGNSLFGR